MLSALFYLAIEVIWVDYWIVQAPEALESRTALCRYKVHKTKFGYMSSVDKI